MNMYYEYDEVKLHYLRNPSITLTNLMGMIFTHSILHAIINFHVLSK